MRYDDSRAITQVYLTVLYSTVTKIVHAKQQIINFYQPFIMVRFMALVFSMLVVSVLAASDDCLRNQIQPLRTIESGFSELFPDHISDAVLSSLVYLKNSTHHLCDGAIVNSRQAIFTDRCLDETALRDVKNGFSEYFVVLGSLTTHNVKNYSIKNVYYEISSELYGNYEPFAIITLTEDVLDVERITWPSIEVDEDSDAVIGGWDKNEKFKMYYVPDVKTEFHVYARQAADGFRGSYVFQKHMLIGLFRQIFEGHSYIGIQIPEECSVYFQVCCGINIPKNPINYVMQLSKKVLCEMSVPSDYEPGFFIGATSRYYDIDSD